MTIPVLTTARLKLRPFTKRDAFSLYKILQQPDILEFFPQTAAPTMKKVEKIIASQLNQYEQHHYGTWAVEIIHDPGLIGWCGLNYLPETGEEEVAYLISQDFQGNGYATECACASLDYGFQKIGMERIICLTHPQNHASRRVAEKIGMTFLDRRVYWGLELLRYEKFNI